MIPIDSYCDSPNNTKLDYPYIDPIANNINADNSNINNGWSGIIIGSQSLIYDIFMLLKLKLITYQPLEHVSYLCVYIKVVSFFKL